MMQATKRRRSQLKRLQERRRAHISNDSRKARGDYGLVLAVARVALAVPVTAAMLAVLWFILALGSM